MVSIVASIGFNRGFNSDLKVSSLYNIGHNKWKALLSTKLQFKDDKNPTWRRILVGCCWMLFSTVEKGLLARA
jgi:hypothetical protein